MPFFKRNPFAKFGPFAAALSDFGYMKLMMPDSKEDAVALRIVRKAVNKPRWQKFAMRLFEEPGWRTEIVGATALLFRPDDRITNALWSAFDGGSWVSPQLSVIAYFSDKEFPERAKAGIETRCPVKEPEDLDPIERHVLTGPAGTVGRMAKNLGSLVAVSERIPELNSWISEMRSQPDIKELLSYDETCDDGGSLSVQYFECITKTFAAEGWPLEPAYQQRSANGM